MWVIYYIVLPVGVLIIAGLFWRFGVGRKLVSWSPWPVALKVNKERYYWETTSLEKLDKYLYRASLEMEIKPWVTTTVYNFYLELPIGGEFIQAQHIWAGESHPDRIGRGYRFYPNTPIGPTT